MRLKSKVGIQEAEKFFEGHFDAMSKLAQSVENWVKVETTYTQSLFQIAGELNAAPKNSFKYYYHWSFSIETSRSSIS